MSEVIDSLAGPICGLLFGGIPFIAIMLYIGQISELISDINEGKIKNKSDVYFMLVPVIPYIFDFIEYFSGKWSKFENVL